MPRGVGMTSWLIRLDGPARRDGLGRDAGPGGAAAAGVRPDGPAAPQPPVRLPGSGRLHSASPNFTIVSGWPAWG